jgi:hypothetical protein
MFFILVLVVAIMMYGCNDKKNKKRDPGPIVTDSSGQVLNLPERPLITIRSTSPESASGMICGDQDEHVIAIHNTTFTVSFNIKAKAKLSQYKIDIHHNFDCHGHSLKTSGTAWKEIRIVDISGHDMNFTEVFTLPENVSAGNYHFMIMAVDEYGNEANFVQYSLKVLNQTDVDSPVMTVNSPSSNLILEGDESIQFLLSVEDENNLAGGRVEITYTDPNAQEFTVDQYYFPTGTLKTTEYSFTHTFSVPPASGIYIFKIVTFDAVGNQSEELIPVSIL